MLTRVSRTALLAMAVSACIAVVVPPVHGAEPASPTAIAKIPTFDVISVKPNNSGERRAMINFTPDGIRILNMNIAFLLRDGFNVNDDELINLPGWARSATYDIEAKVAPEDVATLKNLDREQRAQMMLQVLTDRFHLAYHRETRTLPEYALVVAKGGSKMQEVKPATDDAGKPRNGRMMMGGTTLSAEGVEMAMLARMLSQRVGHPVIDKTGLTGKYSFKLEFAPEPHDGEPPHEAGSAAPVGDTGAPSIFTAVQEQLGLKLESEKGPVDVVIIDRLEQPATN